MTRVVLDDETLQLMDELIAGWSSWDSAGEYYLTVLAPAIVRSPDSAKLEDKERQIVSNLRERLSDEAWAQLPILISERRDHMLEEKEARRQETEERTRQERERPARKEALLAKLCRAFNSDFLSADRLLATDPDAALISGNEYDNLKSAFVRDWASRELDQKLDHEQAAAVATMTGDVKVVARAGSGKTRAIVTRAIFLQKHCRVSPREILLLAFNKKAAEEMKKRLRDALGDDLPHVMTFHALAYALVQPEQELLVDDLSADQLSVSRVVQEVIDEHIRSQEHGGVIRDLMLAHFREDWERIVDGRFELIMEEFLSHRRSLPRESLRGDYVKSPGEKIIANVLFEHGVQYSYEKPRRWNGVNYRPDFTISTGTQRIVIEYFGLEGDPDYDELSAKKRAFWLTQNGWTLLEYSPRNFSRGVDSFTSALLLDLKRLGVSSRRRSEEEIWELVKKRAVDGFTKAMKSFVGRCRKLNLKPHGLEAMVAAHKPCSKAEARFLRVGVRIYANYIQRLDSRNELDFDGLMWRSVSLVRDGQTRFARDQARELGDLVRLRYGLVDEFQDHSMMFFELVDAIRSSKPDAQFFCVGDDWQAINSFAGSELRFFTEFSAHFRKASQRDIRTNYRSAMSVVEIGNALMRGRGTEARADRPDAGVVLLADLADFVPSATERERHKQDEITPTVLRLVSHFLDRSVDVVMLSRTNSVPGYVSRASVATGSPDGLVGFVEHIRSFFPEEDRGRVTGSTIHRYKGLEQSAVIVLDAVRRRYPLFHPNWVFNRIFGDTMEKIEDEERRLFYVAVTRAEDSLVLITEEDRESVFVSDIERYVPLTTLPWPDFPAVASSSGSARLEVRVYDAYEVRDQLKDLKYRWNSAAKCWQRVVGAEGFSFEALTSQPWARNGVEVEVRSESGELLHTNRKEEKCGS